MTDPKIQSNLLEDDGCTHYKNQDLTETLNQSIVSHTILSKRKLSVNERDTTDKKLKQNEVTSSENEEAYPNDSSNYSRDNFHLNLESTKVSTSNYQQPVQSSAAITSSYGCVKNQGKIRVLDAQELNNSIRCSGSLLAPASLQNNVSPIDESTISQNISISTMKDCSNSLIIPAASSYNLMSSPSSSFSFLESKNSNVANCNLAQLCKIQDNRSIHEQVVNPVYTHSTVGHGSTNFSVYNDVTSAQNLNHIYTMPMRPSNIVFTNDNVGWFQVDGQRNLASYAPSSSLTNSNFQQLHQHSTNPVLKSLLMNSESPQGLSSMQPNDLRTHTGTYPVNNVQFPARKENVISQNQRNSLHTTDLLQHILSSIASLQDLYKSKNKLNKSLAQREYYYNILTLKKLFQELAINENQKLDKVFIEYIMQKLTEITKFGPLLSPYEIGCILVFQEDDVKNWYKKNGGVSKSHTSKSSNCMVDSSLQCSQQSTSTSHQSNNSHKGNSSRKKTAAKKKVFTDLQLLIFKQQVNSYKFLSIWINNQLAEHNRLNDSAQLKRSTLVMNSIHPISDTENNVIVDALRTDSIVDASDLTRCETVLNANLVDSRNEQTNSSESNLIHFNVDNLVPSSHSEYLAPINAISPKSLKNLNILEGEIVVQPDRNFEDNNDNSCKVSSIKDVVVNRITSVIKFGPEHLSNLARVSEAEGRFEYTHKTLEQKETSDSNNSLNNSLVKELDICPLKREIDPVFQKESFKNTLGQTENCSLDVPKDKCSTNLITETDISNLESMSSIRDKTGLAQEVSEHSFETSVLLNQCNDRPVNIKKHKMPTDLRNSVIGTAQCSESSSTFSRNEDLPADALEEHFSPNSVNNMTNVDSEIEMAQNSVSLLKEAEKLLKVEKIEHESSSNAMPENIAHLSPIGIKLEDEVSEEFPIEAVKDGITVNTKILTDAEIKADPDHKTPIEDIHPVLDIDSDFMTHVTEKCRRNSTEDIVVLINDATNSVSNNEEYPNHNVECEVSNSIEATVPAILKVHSISCDHFNTLKETKVTDCVDSDSDTNSSCTIPDLDENGCLLCNDKSDIVCELCNKAQYCSKECRETHWEIVHHKTCRGNTSDDDVIFLG